MIKPVTIDFETHGIEPRPQYPPQPIGVAIKYPGKKSHYYAFGHISGNNCGWGDAAEAIAKAWKWEDGLLFHNSKFDVDVAEEFFGMRRLHWSKYHDTLFLVFLDDPNQLALGLKPSAERIFGMKPEEKDIVCDWLLQHQPVPGVKISKSTKSEFYFMKYLAWAPGDLVGIYGEGDVIRTEKLFDKLYPSILSRGMERAYDRERELMPMLLESERQGVPVDTKRLHDDTMFYAGILLRLDMWITKQLGCRSLNIDSGEQLAWALIKAGKAIEEQFPVTPKQGKLQTNRKALEQAIIDPRMLNVLRYRSQLSTCLNTFMTPWMLTAEKSGGRIFTTWNQVKTYGGGSYTGARTGRLSSSPNFQNIPKSFEPLFAQIRALAVKAMEKGPKLPMPPFKDLPPLPFMRGYISPFDDDVLIDRDYSQQELRILAHFDGGTLMDQYKEDPWMDVHEFAMEELHSIGLMYERKKVKNTNFALIYGMGYASLAERNNTTVEDAKKLKQAVLNLYPGLKTMFREMKIRSQQGRPFYTWGGREYYCEEPQIVKGRIQTYDYKMVNSLIQGSAADCTKESLIRYNRMGVTDAKFLITVHDEQLNSAKRNRWVECMAALREAMESVEFDVPMYSEGDYSYSNWYELTEFDRNGLMSPKLPSTKREASEAKSYLKEHPTDWNFYKKGMRT